MSEPVPTGPSAAEENKRGMSKYVARIKSVLRKNDSSKRQSISSVKSTQATPIAAVSSSPPTDTKTEVPTEPTQKDTSVPAPAPATTAAATDASKSVNPDLERARKLAQKYNLQLDLDDWKRGPTQQRVEKAIRMRIHRTCHRCSTTFGSSKICVTCAHQRCEQCPRYPRKKFPGEAGKSKNVATASFPGDEIAVGESATETIEGIKKRRYLLTIPSRTGGQDLVRKKPMQRVRRNCHQCKTLYISPNKTCTGCGHVRCGDCPRDPPKKLKYPYGYPGDADPEDTSRLPSYSCHSCSTPFQSNRPTCLSCGHEKCVECPRIPAKKVNPEPDPDILKRVQERLAGLGMGGTAVGAGADPPPAL